MNAQTFPEGNVPFVVDSEQKLLAKLLNSDAQHNAAAVTPSDVTDLTQPCELYIGVTGDVKVNMSGVGTAIVFKAVPVGRLRIKVIRVYSTGTTATNILALF